VHEYPRSREIDELAKDRQQIVEEFGEAVNITRKVLEERLQTDESRSVNRSDGAAGVEGPRVEPEDR
jgi:CBS-domain-containing membrane protein